VTLYHLSDPVATWPGTLHPDRQRLR